MRQMLSAACVIVLLAGCGATPNGAGSWVKAKGASKPTRVQAPVAVAETVDTLTGDAGSQVSASMTINAPSRAAVSAGAETMSAAQGGLYRSPDGAIEVSVPPGALSRDAVITISPIDTAAQALSDYRVPGMAFKLDLGGAQLTPGAVIQVSSKADARFVAAMHERTPGVGPDAYGLRQDAQGAWVMTMPVKGPAMMPIAAPVAGADWALVEHGALALGAPTRSVLGLSSAADCATFVSQIGVLPNASTDLRAMEAQGVYSCDVVHKTDWFNNVVDDAEKGEQLCTLDGTVDPSTPTNTGTGSVPVPADVAWLSDDPAINLQPAAGVNVRYDLVQAPDSGPSDVVADAGGHTLSYTQAGLPVGLTAYNPSGDRHGGRVTIQASTDMGPVKLFLGDYSPRVVLHLTTEGPLVGHLLLTYTLDGKKIERSLTLPEGDEVADVAFYATTPTTGPHAFKLLTAKTESGAYAVTMPAGLSIERNASYTLPVKLLAPIAK